eukprot:355546-Chlamydomonas_euryale.AAC.4
MRALWRMSALSTVCGAMRCGSFTVRKRQLLLKCGHRSVIHRSVLAAWGEGGGGRPRLRPRFVWRAQRTQKMQVERAIPRVWHEARSTTLSASPSSMRSQLRLRPTPPSTNLKASNQAGAPAGFQSRLLGALHKSLQKSPLLSMHIAVLAQVGRRPSKGALWGRPLEGALWIGQTGAHAGTSAWEIWHRVLDAIAQSGARQCHAWRAPTPAPHLVLNALSISCRCSCLPGGSLQLLTWREQKLLGVREVLRVAGCGLRVAGRQVLTWREQKLLGVREVLRVAGCGPTSVQASSTQPKECGACKVSRLRAMQAGRWA